MSDLIRREYAIKRFVEDGTWLERQGVMALTMVEAKQRAVDILESFPSADAVKGWIPCSERLPDERQDVYVTVLWDDYGDYITAYGMRTRFGWHLHSNAEGELIKGYTVIAWMPLPKPYKGGENE